MGQELKADASPEKNLFISLLTRDIPLMAAFLDLIDNSINSAVEPFSNLLKTAEDYSNVLQDDGITPSVNISIEIDSKSVCITDDATGISADVAQKHVFKFGRAVNESHESDRLSVYGIGLKRALFKLGNRINIISDHEKGGFELSFSVKEWAKEKGPWVLPITTREPVAHGKTGTKIIVTELYEEASRRIDDGVFFGQLKETITKTYAFYISKFVNISLNELPIDVAYPVMGDNRTTSQFELEGVTCSVIAGLGVPGSMGYQDKNSGWFVFCNGRTVISADKTPLTGWQGGGVNLPTFQPKHRPFIGFVYFVSRNPEILPWTTTKSAINEDSMVWQTAKRHMVTVGRTVTDFLDKRYTDDGTDIALDDIKEATGKAILNVISAVKTEAKEVFKAPTKIYPSTIKIQYDAKISEVDNIKRYLGRNGMSASEVGRYTFNYYLKNAIGEQ